MLLMTHQPRLHQPWRLDICGPFIHSKGLVGPLHRVHQPIRTWQYLHPAGPCFHRSKLPKLQHLRLCIESLPLSSYCTTSRCDDEMISTSSRVLPMNRYSTGPRDPCCQPDKMDATTVNELQNRCCQNELSTGLHDGLLRNNSLPTCVRPCTRTPLADFL